MSPQPVMSPELRESVEPDWVLHFLERQALALRAEDAARAAAVFEELLARWPDHDNALRAYGRLLARDRNDVGALPIWQRLRDNRPGDPEPALQLARIHHRARRLAETLVAASAVIAIDPDHGEARKLCTGAILDAYVDRADDAGVLDIVAQVDAHAPWLANDPLMRRLTRHLGTNARRGAAENAIAAGAWAPGFESVRPPLQSHYDRLLFVIHEAALAGNMPALLEGIEAVAPFGDRPETGDILRLHGATLVAHLKAGGASDWPDDACDTVERRLARALRGHGNSVVPLLRRAVDEKRHQHALALLLDLGGRRTEAGDDTVAPDIAGAIAAAFPDGPREATAAATLGMLCAALQAWEQAAAQWQAALALDPAFVNRRGWLRALIAAGARDAFYAGAVAFLTEGPPFEERRPSEQNFIVEIVRRVVQDVQRTKEGDRLAAIEQAMHANPPGRLRGWIGGMFEAARINLAGALAKLDEALLHPPLKRDVDLDLHAERALLFMRYHQYGEAVEAFSQVPPQVIQRLYHKRHEALSTIAEFCPDAPQPLRYPECVIDVILEEIAARPITYEPRAGHLCMVSGSLGQGGGERQTQTMVRRMLQEPRIAGLSLLVRSIHLKPSDDFFYEAVRALGVDHAIYGLGWETPSDVAALLPELADRPRLRRAIELMPHNSREDIVRLCRQFWDRRPQAVHIWQDIYAAALACVIAGVPHFFIHRGSLSPDYWEHNEYQAATHFRIMHHSYRRLLERPDFVILNNSIAGCRTDQNWTQWPDATPFRVVYNAVNFAALGEMSGRNIELRQSLGIADPDAPLIGGSFRIQPVKRPMFWIEAARQILEAVPEAHFLIIGDGDMTDDVASYAREHGFADRMHLPGRVSNVGDWYRAMDLKLLTSEREGIPNAIIEAQHFGVPIVATDVGGIAEAIEPGRTGYVVPGNNPAEYAEACIRILRDHAWLTNARTRAPDYVHIMFSLDIIVDQLMGFYGMGRP